MKGDFLSDYDEVFKKITNEYSSKFLSVNKAIKSYIKPGSRIFIDSGCSEPIDLTKELIRLGVELPDIVANMYPLIKQ